MPDYVSQQATYCAARGSVRIGNDGLEVRKVKPSGVDLDHQYAWSFGRQDPAVIVEGRATPETITLSVALDPGVRFMAAYPNWRDVDITFQVTYDSPQLGSVTYNHQKGKIKSVKATESDGGATSEAMWDLEIMPLGVEVGGVALVTPQ